MNGFLNFMNVYYYPIANFVILVEIASLLFVLLNKVVIESIVNTIEFIKNKKNRKAKEKEFVKCLCNRPIYPCATDKSVSHLKEEFAFINGLLSNEYKEIKEDMAILHKLCSHSYPFELSCAVANIQSKICKLLAPYMQELFVTYSEDMKMFLISDLEHRYYVSFYRNREFERDDSWYIHFLDIEDGVVIRDESTSFVKVLEKINNYYSLRGIIIKIESENEKKTDETT